MEMLKKLWENKMTKLFMIISLGFILIIIIIAVVSSGGGSSNVVDKNLISATKRYLNDNSSMYPINDYDSKVVSLSALVSGGYISSKSEGASCSSYVTVTKLGGSYYYTPYIRCYKADDSVALNEKLVKTVVTSGAGLYNDDNAYIFRGENPNNFITLNTTKWRILGLDENNNVRLVYAGLNYKYNTWDDRYNSVTDKKTGINEYDLSRVKEYLASFLDTMLDKKAKMFPDELKVRLAKFSQCTGKINLETGMVNDCSSNVENQLVGMVTAIDYINTSLDESCSVSNTKNCQNYNFLNKSAWTASAYDGDNYTVYSIDKNTGIKPSEAYVSRAIFPVITLKSDVLYNSGNGTETNPYTIK